MPGTGGGEKGELLLFHGYSFSFARWKELWAYPGVAVGKNLPANAEDTGSVPGKISHAASN